MQAYADGSRDPKRVFDRPARHDDGLSQVRGTQPAAPWLQDRQRFCDNRDAVCVANALRTAWLGHAVAEGTREAQSIGLQVSRLPLRWSGSSLQGNRCEVRRGVLRRLAGEGRRIPRSPAGHPNRQGDQQTAKLRTRASEQARHQALPQERTLQAVRVANTSRKNFLRRPRPLSPAVGALLLSKKLTVRHNRILTWPKK